MLINDAVQGLVRGRIAVGKFDEQKGLWLPTHYQQNQIQYSWGFIAARQLGFKKQVGMLTFFALSSGATGVHGKTFSSGANSKICGFALVAMPVFADATLDVIAARTYLAEENQQVKDASAQAGVTWELIFG
jgi:hypothetical protein